METGKVAKITDKGFGFISRADQDKDIFFHMNEFDGNFDALEEGEELTFDVEEGPKGFSAVNVRKA